jgi:hypothetical protein
MRIKHMKCLIFIFVKIVHEYSNKFIVFLFQE